MPITPTYPGVYIEEISSGVRTIVPASTARTAFIGRTVRGPDNKVTRVQNFGDFSRIFGGLDVRMTLPYAVQQFFSHGGGDALIIRVANEDAVAATAVVNGLPLKAAGPGDWGKGLRVRIDHDVKDEARTDLFSLFVSLSIPEADVRIDESFRNLSTLSEDPRFFKTVLEQDSLLVESDPAVALPANRPTPHDAIPAGGSRDPFLTPACFTQFPQNGADGGDIDDREILGEEAKKTGFHALDRWEAEFSLMVIPPLTRTVDVSPETLANAAMYCQSRRALLIVDPPVDWNDIGKAEGQIEGVRGVFGAAKKNAAIFFPRIKLPDPLKENRAVEFAPSAAIAGICARTDATRGVWKSPAGIEAGFVGVSEFTMKMSDPENGRLNPLGINCLRNLPGGIGKVVWGSRTLDGADRLASEWKYLAVRRMALFLEESLFQGTQWVVFEPNDEPLWAQIRLNLGAFMQGLFRQGAFQGRSPREAYFVKCDKETTTQNDINRGIVNIEIGFAPLKPAEFVIIKIQQMAGEIET